MGTAAVVAKTATCNKCGSTSVAWVQSARNGRWYLALATPTHSVPLDGGGSAGRTGFQVHARTFHKCDDATRGGWAPCDSCGKHHSTPFGLPSADYCSDYPKAV